MLRSPDCGRQMLAPPPLLGLAGKGETHRMQARARRVVARLLKVGEDVLLVVKVGVDELCGDGDRAPLGLALEAEEGVPQAAALLHLRRAVLQYRELGVFVLLDRAV